MAGIHQPTNVGCLGDAYVILAGTCSGPYRVAIRPAHIAGDYVRNRWCAGSEIRQHARPVPVEAA